MHAPAMMSAKKKALSELIKQMRKLELDSDVGQKPMMVEEEMEDDVIEPDMSDIEEAEGIVGKDLDGDDEDPRAELEQFFKKGGKRPSKSRSTVVMAIKDGPVGKMKKTFGKA